MHALSWRNHIEKIVTTLWPQNIEFWPKINIPSSYFAILILNYLKNTLELEFDNYVTAVKFFTQLFFFKNNLTWPNSNTTSIRLDSWLKYSKITQRYAKKLFIHLALVLKISHWYRFHPCYLSNSPVLYPRTTRTCLQKETRDHLWHQKRIFFFESCTQGYHLYSRNGGYTK